MALRSGALRPRPGIGRQWVSSEHRKNEAGFPVLSANHQRFVARRVAVAARGSSSAASKQKGRREAGLFVSNFGSLRRSVLRDDRATPAVVDADGDEIDVLTDAVG